MTINWEAITAVATSLSVLVTLILTWIIINQTNTLNVKQIKLEEELTKKQIDLQKRQLRIDAYPYKREILLNTMKVLEYTNFLRYNILNLSDIYDKSCDDLFQIYETSKKQFFNDDISTLSNSMNEAEAIFTQEISSTILMIRSKFDRICSIFIVLNTLGGMLDTEAIYKIKEYNIKNLIEDCDYINSRLSVMISIKKSELNISNLDKQDNLAPEG